MYSSSEIHRCQNVISITMIIQWGLCALRHGIQISMEAILACHPARSTEWLDCHPKSCELWRIRTGPIATTLVSIVTELLEKSLCVRTGTCALPGVCDFPFSFSVPLPFSCAQWSCDTKKPPRCWRNRDWCSAAATPNAPPSRRWLGRRE